ncbi:MAG: TonB-dependent receptor [Sphingobacteriia bacterium]|nr:TonB-dependent receptor [Sphingobacteriia bacterium]
MRVPVSFLFLVLVHGGLFQGSVLGKDVAIEAIESDSASIKGVVLDENARPLAGASLMLPTSGFGTITDDRGRFVLRVPAQRDLVLEIRYLGYRTERRNLLLRVGELLPMRVQMEPSVITVQQGVTVEADRDRSMGVAKIDPLVSRRVANPSGNFETVLQAFGARSQQEFSSQFQVRGGNYDENMTYLNGIELYRPVLMRSGQQEGLSLIHPDLVEHIHFSAGGFDARYGDKMSSVLDVTYRQPRYASGSVQTGLTGFSVAAEGLVDREGKWSWQGGLRYRTLNSLLQSMDTRGEYRPTASDMQMMLRYQPNERWQWNWLSHAGQNVLGVIPSNRETVFGTVKEALQLRVYFDGQEAMKFRNATHGTSLIFKPHPRMTLTQSASLYWSDERERIDVESAWLLNQLDANLGSDNFGNVLFTRGIGAFQQYARNALNISVLAAEHRGQWQSGTGPHFVQWGLRAQRERIQEYLWEYTLVDSLGFSIAPVLQVPPLGSDADTVVQVYQFLHADQAISSQRYSGFVQDQIALDQEGRWRLNAGIRFNHWTFSGETVWSPRVNLSWKPKWSKDWAFRLAVGRYAQPAFYRDARFPDGRLNREVRAQRATHWVLTADHRFKAWDRPFQWVIEGYYKDLTRLIPYEIDNVRIRYLASPPVEGYAAGLDLRIHGEFVSSLQSWATLSWMKTSERNEEIGWMPRPTDQRVQFAMMFQDYLPPYPDYKVSLNLVFGSRLPYGPPDFARPKDTLRMPPYRRVDIGFSRILWGAGTQKPLFQGRLTRAFRSAWMNLEVFNLLQINNTISYTWLYDTQGYQQNVPNYLSGRVLNLRLVLEW